jgi:hypothetical protein
MITVKEFLEPNPNILQSPDGRHWEPIVPISPWWRSRLADAVAVFRGEAGAIRNTRKSDLKDTTNDHPE